MSQGFSFRVGTALIVGAYAAIMSVLVFGVGRDLWQAVGHYEPQVSWLMSETTVARVAALKMAGHPGAAALYALTASLSWALIGALTAGGFAWGVVHKGAAALGVAKALNYLTAIAALYALAGLTSAALHALRLPMQDGGLQSIPGLWFATMIPSAAILARIGALIAHDAGVLVAICLEAEPQRLARLVAEAEASHGPDSMEARLARLIARRRPAVS